MALTSAGLGAIGSLMGSSELKDIECFPKFRGVRLQIPGPGILQATLNKYRDKYLLVWNF